MHSNIPDINKNQADFDELSNNHINHPFWYNTGKIEVIDFIEDQQLDFHLGNAVKYICRAGKKNSDATSIGSSKISDLKKAVWYIQRVVERSQT